MRPKDQIARLRRIRLASTRPLTPEGNGLQSVYLTEISRGLASALFALIGTEANQVANVGQQVREIEHDSSAPEWERRVEAAIDSDAAISADREDSTRPGASRSGALPGQRARY